MGHFRPRAQSLASGQCPLLAPRVISRRRNNSVAFGAERTLTNLFDNFVCGCQAAFADLEKRSQNAWRRRSGDAKPDNDDPDENNNNERDPADLEAAMEARERARLERDRRGNSAWRNMGRLDPTAADRVQRLGMASRGGK